METMEACDARTPSPEEALARRVVAQYVDGILCALDDRGPSSTPDFKLVRDGETVGWLEVTTGTDPTSTKQWKALEKQSSSFTTDRLRYDWLLLLEPAANVKRIKAESRLLDALVLRELVLTRYPTETIDAGLYEIHHPESDAILDDYGVQHAGWTGLAEGDAVVRLNPGARGAVIDMNLINRLAEERSAAKRHQLDRRPGERHILVRVDPWETTGAGHAMWIGYENHPLPDLPTSPTGSPTCGCSQRPDRPGSGIPPGRPTSGPSTTSTPRSFRSGRRPQGGLHV